jgi:hypothetical protein
MCDLCVSYVEKEAEIQRIVLDKASWILQKQREFRENAPEIIKPTFKVISCLALKEEREEKATIHTGFSLSQRLTARLIVHRPLSLIVQYI